MSTPKQEIRTDQPSIPDANTSSKEEVLAYLNELLEIGRKNTDAEIARQLAAGKLANPLPAVVGKWPGDETLEFILEDLKRNK